MGFAEDKKELCIYALAGLELAFRSLFVKFLLGMGSVFSCAGVVFEFRICLEN